jgi:hypothetical protein
MRRHQVYSRQLCRGFRFSPDEIRLYFTRISDAIEGSSNRLDTADAFTAESSSFSQAGVAELNLDDFLGDDESPSSGSAFVAAEDVFVPAVIDQSIESLRADEAARIKRCEARQEERNAMFDRVLDALGGSEGSYDLPIPARHAKYGTSIVSTHASFVEAGNVESLKDSAALTSACGVMLDPSDVEAQFFAAVSSAEPSHMQMSAAVTMGTWSDATGAFSRLETEPTEVEATTNELWTKLLDEDVSNVPFTSYCAQDVDLADVLKVLSSEPVPVRATKTQLGPLVSPAMCAPYTSAQSPRATECLDNDEPTVAHSRAGYSKNVSAVAESESSDDDVIAQRRKLKHAALSPPLVTPTHPCLPLPVAQPYNTLCDPPLATENETINSLTPVLESLDYVHAPAIMRRVIPPPQDEQLDALRPIQNTSHSALLSSGNSTPTEAWRFPTSLAPSKPTMASFVDTTKHTMLAALLRHT